MYFSVVFFACLFPTGDIGVAAWHYFLMTGDHLWLRDRGWPLLQAIAEFHQSRVSLNFDKTYSIKGILPIDEWCVQSGCGCEAPGVEDDAQMNAVAKVSMMYAVEAAKVLITAP